MCLYVQADTKINKHCGVLSGKYISLNYNRQLRVGNIPETIFSNDYNHVFVSKKMNTIRNESIIDYMIENKKSNCNIINPLTAFMLVKS